MWGVGGTQQELSTEVERVVAVMVIGVQVRCAGCQPRQWQGDQRKWLNEGTLH